MNRRLAFALGVLGALLGVAAVVADLAWLGLGAGAAALAAGALALWSPTTTVAEPAPTQVGTLELELAENRSRLVRAEEELSSARRRLAEVELERHPAPDPPVVGELEGLDGPTLTEPESQLFSEAYFRVALDSRLASARRHLRPVAVALIDVAEGLAVDATAPAPPDRVAEAIRETVREADIACRLDDGCFAVILEDTPENGAVWTVERIRRNLVSRFGSHTMWAGVACYPAHAFTTDELLEQSRAALTAAQEWKQDRIEVAVAD